MIIYTCPKCGADIIHEVICTYPPINVAKCTKCDWKDEKREEITRVPYGTNANVTLENINLDSDICLNTESLGTVRIDDTTTTSTDGAISLNIKHIRNNL